MDHKQLQEMQQTISKKLDDVIRFMRQAEIQAKDFDDGHRSSLIMRARRILTLAGIDAHSYERIAPKPVDPKDPLLRELLGGRPPSPRRARAHEA